MRNLNVPALERMCYIDIHSDLANWWSFPQAQSNKKVENKTEKNSFTSGDFVFHILI